MRYLSLFSGIEAATVAWEPIGFEPVAFAEIDKFAASLLADKYPHIPNLGDVTKITESQIKELGEIDLIVFGSPCQDISVAGKRAGLEGKRSGLFRTAIDIIQWARKHCGLRYALWENVPGAFSSNQGRDFAEVVASMAGLRDVNPPPNGWGTEGAAVGDHGLLEWAVLDSQYFGLAQRRKRVFAIVDFGDWASRPPILLERESLRGNSPPSREERKSIAANVETSAGTECHRLISFGQYKSDDIASTLRARDSRDATDLITFAIDPLGSNSMKSANPYAGHNKVTVSNTVVTGSTLPNGRGGLVIVGRNTTKNCLAFDCKASASHMPSPANELAPTLRSMHGEKTNGGGHLAVCIHQGIRYTVRRLTPLECERLQGFPDNYTSKLSDAQRYKTLGNSMAVPVMRWIGEQIKRCSTWN